MPYDFDLAAVQAAKLGKKAAVVEKRREAGGVCVDTILHFSRIGTSRFETGDGIRNSGRPTAERGSSSPAPPSNAVWYTVAPCVTGFASRHTLPRFAGR